MITTEDVKSEIEKVPPERLEELNQVVKSFTQPQPSGIGRSFMAKLREVKIAGPEDFAAKLARN